MFLQWRPINWDSLSQPIVLITRILKNVLALHRFDQLNSQNALTLYSWRQKLCGEYVDAKQKKQKQIPKTYKKTFQTFGALQSSRLTILIRHHYSIVFHPCLLPLTWCLSNTAVLCSFFVSFLVLFVKNYDLKDGQAIIL